jgi:hypothetical protein
VAGGILMVCVLGMVAALVGAAAALRSRMVAPWSMLAGEIATDLRGLPGQPVKIDDAAAAQRLQDSREQLHGLFARPAGSGGGARVGLSIAALILTTLLRRRAQISGLGVILPLGIAALRFWRRKKSA